MGGFIPQRVMWETSVRRKIITVQAWSVFGFRFNPLFFTNTELAADLYCDSFYIALSNKDMILITNMWEKNQCCAK